MYLYFSMAPSSFSSLAEQRTFLKTSYKSMKYFPILLSKAGELNALKHLNQNTKDEISPVLQVLQENLGSIENFLTEAWSFPANQILLDFSLIGDVSAEIHRIEAVIRNSLNNGVHVVPVIQQNSPGAYSALISDLAAATHCNVCIRTSNTSGGFINYHAQLATIGNSLNLAADRLILLLDLGVVNQNNHNNNAAMATAIIGGIRDLDLFRNVVVAAGSFPENLGNLQANRVHRLRRYEWDLWRAIQNAGLPRGIDYGDYGIKNPVFAEVGFIGSCSIKYTTPTEFVIHRGEVARNHPHGNGQYIIFSQQLVGSPYYSGANFSWGDNRIQLMANQNVHNGRTKPGNATTWVEISQNHHITLMETLV